MNDTTHHTGDELEPLLTIEEVAGWLSIKPETVRAMARRGAIPSIKVGHIWRFRRSTIETWLDDNSLPAT